MLLAESRPTHSPFSNMFASPVSSYHSTLPHAHSYTPPSSHTNAFMATGYQSQKRSYVEDGDEDEWELSQHNLKSKRPRIGDFEPTSSVSNTYVPPSSSRDQPFIHSQPTLPETLPEELTQGSRIIDISSGEALEVLQPSGSTDSTIHSSLPPLADHNVPQDSTTLVRTYSLSKRVRDRFDEFDRLVDIWRQKKHSDLRFEDDIYGSERFGKRVRTEGPFDLQQVATIDPSKKQLWQSACNALRGNIEYTDEFAKVASAFRSSPYLSNFGDGSEMCQELVLYRPLAKEGHEVGEAQLVELIGNERIEEIEEPGKIEEDAYEEDGTAPMDLD